LLEQDVSFIMGRPLEAAAEEFRDRISGELNMFAVVAVLLATMTFTAFVTAPGAMVMREIPSDADTSIAALAELLKQLLGNATNTTTSAPTSSSMLSKEAVPKCYNGYAWTTSCLWLNGFLVCDFVALTLSLVVTGMYVRFSTVLRYCPTGKYVVWFIHRMEPSFALLHVVFMFSIHLAILAAGFVGWGVWVRLTGPGVLIGITVAAAVCLLYFEYSYGNSMFCRDHGLTGVLSKLTGSGGTSVEKGGANPSIQDLVKHFRSVLAKEPFGLYTELANMPGTWDIVSKFDDWPGCCDPWCEDNIKVTIGKWCGCFKCCPKKCSQHTVDVLKEESSTPTSSNIQDTIGTP
jgi:hypothetical protein